MKGHNNPPPLDAFTLHIEELFSLVSGSTAGPVSNDEQEAALDELLKDVRKAKQDADAQRAAEKKPHDDAAKAVQASWKPLLDRCDAAMSAIKDALSPYREARQKAKDEAARKSREEAEAKQKAAQEALRKSDDLETKFAAEEELKQASKLAAVANKIDRSATGLRSFWTHTITDRRALLEWVMRNDPDGLTAMLDEYARQHVARGTRYLPGVEIKQERRAA